jgi:hypothetical protein
MSAYPDDPNVELRQTVSVRRAVIVVGSGVSIGASWDSATKSSHPQAS